MPLGRVLSIGELTRSPGAFPFLPFLQKRKNESDSVVSVSLAKSPADSCGDKRVVGEMPDFTLPKGQSLRTGQKLSSESEGGILQ
jgi:hypothetical protein